MIGREAEIRGSMVKCEERLLLEGGERGLGGAGGGGIRPRNSIGDFSPHHSSFSRHLQFPHSMLFLLCLPLHSHLNFVWFSLLFLSPNFGPQTSRHFQSA